jgi:hypothetical protein
MGTRQPTPMTRQAAERIAAAATRDPHRPRPPALDQPLEGGAERLRRPRQRGQEVALSHQLHRSLDTPHRHDDHVRWEPEADERGLLEQAGRAASAVTLRRVRTRCMPQACTTRSAGPAYSGTPDRGLAARTFRVSASFGRGLCGRRVGAQVMT